MTEIAINSESEAFDFWINTYGEPVAYSSFDEIQDPEDKLEELRKEKKEIEKEIEFRNVSKMNEYTIDRAIELHFLVLAGEKYIDECQIQAGMKEEAMEDEYVKFTHEFDSYNDPYREDGLFPRDYEEL